VSVRALITTGFVILGLAMWYFASFNLFTDYRREALARGLQGFGLAFLFIPISQLAYSYLPANKNNKASSLTNLFRNLGGTVGIATVTTLLERRSQYHQTVLAAHLGGSNATLTARLSSATARLASAGYTTADAALRAPAQIAGLVHQQATLLGALDCFYFLGAVALIGPILALGIRAFDQGGTKGGGH